MGGCQHIVGFRGSVPGYDTLEPRPCPVETQERHDYVSSHRDITTIMLKKKCLKKI